MAELLVYNTLHWFDKLTIEEQAKKIKEFGEWEFEGRYIKGDVVQVKDDGYRTGKNAKGFRKDKFSVVILPGKKEDYEYLLESKEYEKNQKSYSQRRIYKILNDISSEVNNVSDLQTELKSEWLI